MKSNEELLKRIESLEATVLELSKQLLAVSTRQNKSLDQVIEITKQINGLNCLNGEQGPNPFEQMANMMDEMKAVHELTDKLFDKMRAHPFFKGFAPDEGDAHFDFNKMEKYSGLKMDMKTPGTGMVMIIKSAIEKGLRKGHISQEDDTINDIVESADEIIKELANMRKEK